MQKQKITKSARSILKTHNVNIKKENHKNNWTAIWNALNKNFISKTNNQNCDSVILWKFHLKGNAKLSNSRIAEDSIFYAMIKKSIHYAEVFGHL